ncbi:radial spoke head protein 9 homolog [Girardinichthys multiradiatus]|uniref:radial spoke head protein 9 homolog n=1 Tax=Girardinichthys multiradiatus TaxID=208333 RepID=UPI001FAD3954|nr:radial spoke head protein 9 homolog [Girardinichthys multiradiatus]
MDSNSLYYSLDLVASSGRVLTVEQRTALHTSLLILKKNYKFQRVMFWGKILGIKRDYFIAQGRGEDEIKDQKYLYSLNCIDWLLLPFTTESMIEEVSKAAKGHFIGDPSFVYEQKIQGDREETAEENKMTTVNEEKRLAVTVKHIDEDVSVVPRGAFIRSPLGLVQINRSFNGLSESEARKLENFLHFREQKNGNNKSIEEMGEWSPAIDFLDVLSDEVPAGSWSLQFECASRVCVLRSLLWLGLTFYHVPMTSQHGYVYIGNGLKNLDLPFML